MALTYSIDPSRRLIVARGSGVLTEEELRSTRALMQGDPAFDHSFGQLLDLRGFTEIKLSVPSMARIAASSAFAPGVRRAFVGTTEMQYETARTFAVLSEPHDQHVYAFRDISVAEAWLMEQRPSKVTATRTTPAQPDLSATLRTAAGKQAD